MAAPNSRHPIVMVHGLLGFGRLNLLGWEVYSYFPGIPEALQTAGYEVLTPSLSPTASVAQRATELKRFLDENAPDKKLHLIGHSMGGLDCRYLISRLGMHERVLSLTTIGTPHRGTVFADWAIRHFGPVVRPVLELFGIPTQAFYDLTREKCARFNEETPNAAQVRYYSVAGQLPTSAVPTEWLFSHGIIHEVEGPNDGLVSVGSAQWGPDPCAVWDADHSELVNWANPASQIQGRWRDRVPDYLMLVRRLEATEITV